jgi:hypothetical protein
LHLHGCTSFDPNTFVSTGAACCWMEEIPKFIRLYEFPARGCLPTRQLSIPVWLVYLRLQLMPQSISLNCKAMPRCKYNWTRSWMCSNPTHSRQPVKRNACIASTCQESSYDEMP